MWSRGAPSSRRGHPAVRPRDQGGQGLGFSRAEIEELLGLDRWLGDTRLDAEHVWRWDAERHRLYT
jgi:hypothetical protein